MKTSFTLKAESLGWSVEETGGGCDWLRKTFDSGITVCLTYYCEAPTLGTDEVVYGIYSDPTTDVCLAQISGMTSDQAILLTPTLP